MQSHESPLARIAHQFLLTRWEILFLVITNGTVLLAVFYSLSVTHSKSVSEFQSFTEVIIVGRIFGWFKEIVGITITANVATMLLWGVIGSFVYSIITAVQSVFSDANTTFKTAMFYVHPAKYSTSEFIIHAFVARIVSIMIVFVMVIYAWSLASIIVPFVFTAAKESILPLSLSSFSAAGYFVVFTLTLHGLVVLFRLESGRYKPDRE